MEEHLHDWNFVVKLVDDKVTINVRSNDQIINFNFVIRPLRFEGPQYYFMDYLLSHPDTDISRFTVNFDVKECENVKDLTEQVRFCGFNLELKKLFFPLCKSTKLRFVNSVNLPQTQAARLTARLQKISNKYRK